MRRWVHRLCRAVVDWATSGSLAQGLQSRAGEEPLTVPALASAARALAAEGIVVLENPGVLPLAPTARVAVFGRCAVDYFAVGYGSGGDVRAPYVLNLMDGLSERHTSVHEALAAFYRDYCKAHRPDEGYWGHWPTHYPEPKVPRALLEQAARESDVAVVVLGRAAGEDRECSLKPGSYYLTGGEKELLRAVTAAFRQVCVVLDCGNVMDLSFLDGLPPVAVVFAFLGGMEAGGALADVLTGAVNPSGRLADTIARSYRDYPSAANFGGRRYNAYREDIYVGYRYFETFAPQRVRYPFGYGLSYTTFALRGSGTAKALEVIVTNTGALPGRTVVQVYLALPQGKLGNPRRVLAAFEKTALLAPGEVQRLTFAINLADFAPFDDTGVTGYPHCRVLEAGAYALEVGQNARDVETVCTWRRGETGMVERLHPICPLPPQSGFARLVNRGGPVYEVVPTAFSTLARAVRAALPDAYTPPEQTVTFADVAAGRADAEALVAQLDAQELDQLLRGFGKMNAPWGPPGNAGALGGVTEALRRRGLPPAVTVDGPAGIRQSHTAALLPCGTALACTFDPTGVETLYGLVGRELAALDADILLAPGMNLHRNPLCGRNFEYFSEDPLLTGKLAAAVVRGVQSAGRAACPKHFACNNQEKRRNTHDSRLSQRALRELYLKGFEIAVKEGRPWVLMTSYNRVNGIYSYYHFDLAATVLRREWGYDGLVITDWWMRPGALEAFPGLRSDGCRVRAQVDVLMPGETRGDRRALLDALESGALTLGEAQRCACRVVKLLLRLQK